MQRGRNERDVSGTPPPAFQYRGAVAAAGGRPPADKFTAGEPESLAPAEAASETEREVIAKPVEAISRSACEDSSVRDTS